MSPTYEAFVRSWPSEPWLAATLVLTSAVYARGWYTLRQRDPDRWHVGRLAAFLGGLAGLYLALASPLEPFAELLLQVHMLQHLLLMMVAPPLIWLGWPLFPIVRGLPESVRTYWVIPLLRWNGMRRVFSRLTHPGVAWPLFVAATWLWHVPPAYELALTNDVWHFVEHTCFTGSALLFWYPVVRPYPSRPRWSRWILFPYLLLADVQNTVLAAWLTFSPDVLYPHYLQTPRLDGLSALADQRAAGVIMWVPGSIVFLLPLFWIGVAYLMGADHPGTRRIAQRSLRPKPREISVFDFLEVRYVGTFLRWRHSRSILQLAMAGLAVLIVIDGLNGPQVSPVNLAGVLPWIHWRGLLILSLLIVGNVFCLACPFTLPRSLADRWLPGGRPWPAWLRSKWLAVVLVGVFLWSYEAFALWDSPWITAWITLGYFAMAFVVDSLFTGGAFCKYVCPIGQFNFVQSLVSPVEVAVRQPAVCASCTTRECTHGSNTIAGCAMELSQPLKTGNMDCTFCLDCVHACPHSNVGLLAAVPARTLWIDPQRSGIGRFSRRPDLAALVLVLTFGAFANAAGMVAPVVDAQDRVQELFEISPLLATTAFYGLAIVVAPLIAVTCAATLSRWWDVRRDKWMTTATRFTFALVPIGFTMWLAHYTFHLFTSWDTVIPAVQRFSADRGWTMLGDPAWQWACCSPAANWVTQCEILMLDVGLLVSLYAGFRIAEAGSTGIGATLRVFWPWAVLIVLLFAAGLWIVFQPMEMRGTLPPV